MPRSPRPIPLAAAAAALLAAGCAASGPRVGLSPARASVPSCVLAPAGPTAGAGRARRDLEVALERPVDPASAPRVTGGSSRLVFRQIYQTLVRIDCHGRARPDLAASWSHDAAGTRWSFTLRPGARFWDGAPVTARAVARSWAEEGGAGPSPIASESVTGLNELTVFLTRPSINVATFAQPALAVTAAGKDGPWPVGSGPYRPVPAAGLARRDLLVAARAGHGEPDSIAFDVVGSADARGALDRGVDVLVSADPEVLAYARALPGFTTVALPWSRTYVLAAFGTGEAGGGAEVPVEDLERLARGAVQADARPAQPPFWWRGDACGAADPPVPDAASRRRAASSDPLRNLAVSRIVFPTGDAVARSLAARLVGLAGLGSATPSWLSNAVPGLAGARGTAVAAGLAPAALVRAVRDGDALAFVVPVPRAPGGPCVSALLAAGDDMAATVLSPESGLRVTPLLDARPSLVIRNGTAGVALDGDGTLIFGPPRDAP